jgi:hypothetical protein
MNAGVIDTISIGIQSRIISVGLVKEWLGATTPANAVIAIKSPAALLINRTIGLQANLPYLILWFSADL